MLGEKELVKLFPDFADLVQPSGIDLELDKIYVPAYALVLDGNGKAVCLPGYDNEQGDYASLFKSARKYDNDDVKDFGGLSGDLAGWFLQTAELWMLAALTLRHYVEAIL